MLQLPVCYRGESPVRMYLSLSFLCSSFLSFLSISFSSLLFLPLLSFFSLGDDWEYEYGVL